MIQKVKESEEENIKIIEKEIETKDAEGEMNEKERY